MLQDLSNPVQLSPRETREHGCIGRSVVNVWNGTDTLPLLLYLDVREEI